MQRYAQIGEYVLEVTEVRLRRAEKLGADYSLISTLRFVGGTCFVEALLSNDDRGFTRQDIRLLSDFSKDMCCKKIEYSRYHFDKKREATINI